MAITVKSNLPGSTVALWERHPDHPTGEVFLAGDRQAEVAMTARVQAALADGRLVEIVVKKVTTKKPDADTKQS
jgi:hypothetical protein